MRRIAAKYLYPLVSAEPVQNGFVELEDDGTVVRTGVCADPAAEPVFYDGAVAPGLVNAHCHVELSYLKGQFRKGTGMAGFIDQINEMRDNKSLEEKVHDLTVAMDSLWEQGVVAMADISNCADTFAVKARHPMYTRTFLEVFGTEPEDCDAVMDGVRRLKETADCFGIDAAPTPHACYTMSPKLVTAVSVEGLKSGFLSFHSEETEEEEEMLKYGSGKMWENRVRAGMSVPPVTGKSSLLYFIDRLLAGHPAPFGEHILLVHECCMDQEGIDAVKAVMNHPFVAVCPLSNLFIHNALPPIDLMRRNDLKVCVGTDSLSSNDDLNLVDELFCLQRNFPEVPLGELLTWASRNGAEFLARPEFGTLEPGKRPGLVFIDNLDADGRLTAASKSRRL
jgi:cytosine/adenosine deaminase-related metal-dependent hydrolase